MSSREEFHEKLTELTQQHLESVAGGSCTASQIETLARNAIETYENLVDATSYIIERIANATTGP